MRASRVLVIGDLLYDMIAEVEGPVALGTDTFVPIRASAGGSAANAAAWLAHLDVETHFVGRVGEDPFGAFLAEEMERSGVRARLAYDSRLATGKVFVLVGEEGERTMITDRGASEALRPEDLPEELFGSGTHLHLTGYTFSGGTRRETAFAALNLAREAGMTVSVDPSSVPLLRVIGPDRFLGWTRGADLFFPNLREGALLAGTDEPERIIANLFAYYPGVVLKLGAEGALYSDADGGRINIAAPSVRPVDTTGAGDALCAGFLAAWISGAAPGTALREGVDSAARVVAQTGARPRVGG